MKFLIGFAKDIHNLQKNNKPLILGGYQILDNQYSITAHSDGDLILHAIASAFLGAMGSCLTIGQLFSDQDENNKNMDSRIIVNQILKIMKENKVKINNLDITIVCEQIMLSEHLNQIQQSLAKLLSAKHIGIKCTRFEDVNNYQIECSVTCSLKKAWHHYFFKSLIKSCLFGGNKKLI